MLLKVARVEVEGVEEVVMRDWMVGLGVVVGVEEGVEPVDGGLEESVVVSVAMATAAVVGVVALTIIEVREVDFPDELGVAVVLLVVTGASVTVFRYVVFDLVGNVLETNVPVLE